MIVIPGDRLKLLSTSNATIVQEVDVGTSDFRILPLTDTRFAVVPSKGNQLAQVFDYDFKTERIHRLVKQPKLFIGNPEYTFPCGDGLLASVVEKVEDGVRVQGLVIVNCNTVVCNEMDDEMPIIASIEIDRDRDGYLSRPNVGCVTGDRFKVYISLIQHCHIYDVNQVDDGKNVTKIHTSATMVESLFALNGKVHYVSDGYFQLTQVDKEWMLSNDSTMNRATYYTRSLGFQGTIDDEDTKFAEYRHFRKYKIDDNRLMVMHQDVSSALRLYLWTLSPYIDDRKVRTIQLTGSVEVPCAYRSRILKVIDREQVILMVDGFGTYIIDIHLLAQSDKRCAKLHLDPYYKQDSYNPNINCFVPRLSMKTAIDLYMDHLAAVGLYRDLALLVCSYLEGGLHPP